MFFFGEQDVIETIIKHLKLSVVLLWKRYQLFFGYNLTYLEKLQKNVPNNVFSIHSSLI